MADKNERKKEYDRQYRKKNRERIREYDRKWRQENIEHVRAYQREYHKRWRAKKRAERLNDK